MKIPEAASVSYLRRLREAVLQKISSGHLGEPVFARLVLAVSADHGHLLPAAGEGVALAGEVLRAQVQRVYAGGSVKSGHLAVQVELEAGRTALVTVAMLRHELPRVDLLVIGNHGTLYHENNEKALSQEFVDVPGFQFFKVTTTGQHAQEAVRQSLSKGEPVSVVKGAD